MLEQFVEMKCHSASSVVMCQSNRKMFELSGFSTRLDSFMNLISLITVPFLIPVSFGRYFSKANVSLDCRDCARQCLWIFPDLVMNVRSRIF